MPHNIDYYLSKGFDRKAAEYFAAGRKRITGVTPNDDLTLTISFDGGERRLYNAVPLLSSRPSLAPLLELSNFRRVYLDDSHVIAWDIDPHVDSSVHWSNKVDLCPDSCYLDSTPLEGGAACV